MNQTFNSYYHRMRLDEMYYTEIEMEGMKEILRDKEEEIKKLKSDLSLVIKERDDNIEQNKKLKSREEKLMAYYKWYVDKDHNLTEVEDIITENIKLNERVEELERLVRELIQWKEDKKIIQIDKNRKESGLAIHNYHIEETKKEDEVYDEDEVDEEYEEDDEIRLLNSIS